MLYVNLYEGLTYCMLNTKEDTLKNVGNQTVAGRQIFLRFFSFFSFHTMEVNGYQQLSVLIEVWNNFEGE